MLRFDPNGHGILQSRSPCFLGISFGSQFSQLEACLLPMGLTSENVAAAYGIPRDRQDIMAADSHKKVGSVEEKQTCPENLQTV